MKQLVTSDEAVPTDTQPAKPCSDCPFARTALRGWLGSASAQEWIQLAHGEARADCHTLIGPQCAGLAIYRSNVHKRPRDKGLLLLPSDTKRVFASSGEFLTHHDVDRIVK